LVILTYAEPPAKIRSLTLYLPEKNNHFLLRRLPEKAARFQQYIPEQFISYLGLDRGGISESTAPAICLRNQHKKGISL